MEKLFWFYFFSNKWTDHLMDNYTGSLYLDSSTNRISGFVKESRIPGLKEYYRGQEITFVESSEYWANYDKYNNSKILHNEKKQTPTTNKI